MHKNQQVEALLLSIQGMHLRQYSTLWVGFVQGEDEVRQSGVPYAVVRPCALTEEPAGAELVISQGDTIKVTPLNCFLWETMRKEQENNQTQKEGTTDTNINPWQLIRNEKEERVRGKPPKLDGSSERQEGACSAHTTRKTCCDTSRCTAVNALASLYICLCCKYQLFCIRQAKAAGCCCSSSSLGVCLLGILLVAGNTREACWTQHDY